MITRRASHPALQLEVAKSIISSQASAGARGRSSAAGEITMSAQKTYWSEDQPRDAKTRYARETMDCGYCFPSLVCETSGRNRSALIERRPAPVSFPSASHLDPLYSSLSLSLLPLFLSSSLSLPLPPLPSSLFSLLSQLCCRCSRRCATSTFSLLSRVSHS